jgi:hypothetical protein
METSPARATPSTDRRIGGQAAGLAPKLPAEIDAGELLRQPLVGPHGVDAALNLA